MQLDQPVDEDARDRRLGLAFGQLECGVLEVDQPLAERLALLDVVDGQLAARARSPPRRATRDGQPLLRQLLHQLDEALALLARRAGSTVGTRTSSKNSSDVSCASSPILSRLRPRVKPSGLVGFDDDQRHALGAARRVGLGDDDDQIGGWPLVMKVFWPLMT